MRVRYCADQSIVFGMSKWQEHKKNVVQSIIFPILKADSEERLLSEVHCYSWKSSIELATENH
jgi:hypothetical protein